MYKELRATPSAPEQWDENFASSFHLTGSRLYHQLFRLNRKLFDPLWTVVTEGARPGDRVLDAGCGPGQWVALLNEHGIRAAGLDYSERMIATLRQREPHIEWIAGRIQAIPAERESFAAVFSWGVIEHDESGPQAALFEFRRVLKPGGRLIVTVPIDTPETRRLSEAECSASPSVTEFYQYFFTPDELRGELARAGFTVTAVRPCLKHYGVAFPGLHTRLPRHHVIASVVGLAMKAILAWRSDAYHMLLGTAVKPR